MGTKSNQLSRKQFLQFTAAAPVLSALAPQAEPQPPAGRKPNVLIIMTDQHRRNYMGAAGSSIVPTPNIDRLAARGVRFTNTICPYPVCAASRASLLTGLHAHTTGVINNTDLLNWKTPTVAHHFANRGYHTGLIGKMHFNDGHTHGFQYFLGFNDWFMYLGPKVQYYADAIANHPLGDAFFKTVNDDGSGLPELPSVWGEKRPWAGHVKRIGLASELDPQDSFDAFVARESCRFLERCGQERFFLVASFLRPHPPLHPPADWAAKYPVEKMELRSVGEIAQYPKWIQRNIARYQGLGAERLKQHRAGYLGNLAYVDTCIGELYKTLVRLGLDQDTIVIYTADHGEMDGDHGLYQKFCFFEPSVGVPLIVSQPGTIPENKVCDALVEYFGIYPSLAELTGAPAPSGIEAQSFANLVRDPGARGPEAIFSEYNLRSPYDCYMIRDRRHKYIYNHDDISELYDLEADPGENHNLAGQPGVAQVQKRLHEQLIAWYDPATNPYRPGKKQN
jgi:choline-sulfatase